MSTTLKYTGNVAKPFDPKSYIMHPELANAVEVALSLNQPLLLTGEPGTGKTKLAFKVALDLAENNQDAFDFAANPLIYNTKTTSSARDLFYTYDALAHFQAANIKRENSERQPTTADFIELQALGRAIAQTSPEQIDTSKFSTSLTANAQSSVVLIDEIDKAPRDFTNDILNEIENYRFQIKEQDNYEIGLGAQQRILIIMTSNSEKNLPDAFLRRCVFYHIPFPDKDLLYKIVLSQLSGSKLLQDETKVKNLIDLFNQVREKAVRKAPATAELIGWLRILELQNYLDQPESIQREKLRNNLSILIKTKEDMDAVKALF